MKLHHCLLLILSCLLFPISTGGSSLTGLGHRSDHYMCVKNGGFCLYSNCPLYSKVSGTCYKGKANCCK